VCVCVCVSSAPAVSALCSVLRLSQGRYTLPLRRSLHRIRYLYMVAGGLCEHKVRTVLQGTVRTVTHRTRPAKARDALEYMFMLTGATRVRVCVCVCVCVTLRSANILAPALVPTAVVGRASALLALLFQVCGAVH
jgi:hypothetical protein